MRVLLTLSLALMLSGCVARTAANIVTAPVRAVGQVADWATTSQDEADRNAGRELRERDEQLGRDYRECREDYDEAYCDELFSSRRSPEHSD